MAGVYDFFCPPSPKTIKNAFIGLVIGSIFGSGGVAFATTSLTWIAIGALAGSVGGTAAGATASKIHDECCHSSNNTNERTSLILSV